MHVIRRVLLYIVCKKRKTFGLFMLIFVVAVFLTSSLEVLHGSEQIVKAIRSSFGAAFYIRANTQVQMNESGEMEVEEHNTHITQKQIDEIMQIKEIQSYNPINYGFAKSAEIEFIHGDKDTKDNNMGKITGTRISTLVPDFIQGRAVLVEGKHIVETDKEKILISQQLADANHIVVGDILTLTHAKPEEQNGIYVDTIQEKTAYVQVEVAGIYRWNVEDTAMKPTVGVADNGMYASLDVLNALDECESDVYTGEVDFYLFDPEQLRDVTERVQLLQSIDWSTHFIRTNDFQYSRVSDQLLSFRHFAMLLFVIAAVIGTGSLTMLLVMRMRGRIKEVGILLAVGNSKVQIVAGFLLEILFVAIIALSVSYGASMKIVECLQNSYLQDVNLNLLMVDSMERGVQQIASGKSYLRLSIMQIIVIYICQILVIIMSTLVSSVVIMRWQPKEILSQIH